MANEVYGRSLHPTTKFTSARIGDTLDAMKVTNNFNSAIVFWKLFLRWSYNFGSNAWKRQLQALDYYVYHIYIFLFNRPDGVIAVVTRNGEYMG